MHRTDIHRPASTVVIVGTFVTELFVAPRSTAEANSATALVSRPSAGIPDDLYILNPAAAPVPAAAVATLKETFDIVMAEPVSL